LLLFVSMLFNVHRKAGGEPDQLACIRLLGLKERIHS
jgi:hypothetical protein